MFVNTKVILKIVFLNTNFKIWYPEFAISCFISFLCNVKQIKQDGYEQNYEGNGSSNADGGFCGGLHKT